MKINVGNLGPAHVISLRELLARVTERGGDMDTVLTIESDDGEPVCIYCDAPARAIILPGSMAQAITDPAGYQEYNSRHAWHSGGTRTGDAVQNYDESGRPVIDDD